MEFQSAPTQESPQSMIIDDFPENNNGGSSPAQYYTDLPTPPNGVDSNYNANGNGNSSFLLNHGGKIVAILVGFSTLIFLILFYDSIAMNEKLASKVPDMASQINDLHKKAKFK